MTTIAFPGMGIGEFKINPIAFTIPIGSGIEVRWYGLLIVTGMILAFFYCAYRSKQEGISFDDLLDFALFTVPCAIIGARAYYVLTTLDEYNSFLEMLAIWNGGIAIYGAIIAGAITILTVCKVKKYSINKMFKLFDSVAPAVMIGQILGRWGNFCNGEAYGAIVEEGHPLHFLRMGLISSNTLHDFKTYEMVFVHPTFLYESLWNLVGFAIIHFLYKKKKFDGQIVLMYLAWYGFGRMFIEGLRTDSLYVGSFRISQVIGALCFVICTALLIVGFILTSKKAKRSAAIEVIAEENIEVDAEADTIEEQIIETNEIENTEEKDGE